MSEFKNMKVRAERAEARVAELEKEVAALRAAGEKFEEPLSKLVPVVNPETGLPVLGQWEYAK